MDMKGEGDDISKRTFCFNFFQDAIKTKKTDCAVYWFFVMMGVNLL